jgi:hypothetical protein
LICIYTEYLYHIQNLVRKDPFLQRRVLFHTAPHAAANVATARSFIQQQDERSNSQKNMLVMRLHLLLLPALLLLTTSFPALSLPLQSPQVASQNWVLSWSDEFEGDGINAR